MGSPFVKRTAALLAGGILMLGATAVPAAAESAGDQVLVDLSMDLTPEDLARTLVGDDVAVENVRYTGHDMAAGLADGFEDVFGIPGGVVLASGGFSSTPGIIRGPNDSTATSLEFFQPGDPDLEVLAGDVTHDAAVLEFDFVPASDELRLDYVFGSDEYHEYVGVDSDVFAIFVNGENCAVVGDDAEPVSINTVNLGSNAALFVDNDLLTLGAAPHDTQFDGFTTVLTCVADVVAGETNHIKLGLADGGSSVIDTGVFDSAAIIAPGLPDTGHAPVADDQAVETYVDTPVEIALTGTDEDGDELGYEVVSEPEHGTLSGEAPDLTYTPAEGYVGEDAFTFTVSDGTAVSEPATVTVSVV
ncbi:choice-of-anchor L domain-containing protein, partial [Jiangella rhizosphaerae]